MASINFRPPVIAHRGASGYAPENTLSAFIKAADLGIKWVEFDVMQAACGEVVVFHDDILDRITNGKGPVVQYPYSYLRTLDAGSWFDPAFSGERIPTLAQVLEFLQSAKINANIEIKALPGQEEQLVKRVLTVMKSYLLDSSSTFLFSSFSIDALQFLRKHSSDYYLGLLMHDWLPNWHEVCEKLNCISVHVYDEILTHHLAKEIKNKDKALLCYTINNRLRANEVYSWGVDAVFSDFPDRFLKFVND